MKIKTLWAVWGGLYAASALFGFLPNPNGLLKAIMVLMSLGFFVTGGLLLWKGSGKNVKLVRNLAICSLTATLVFLILNLLSVQATRAVGNVLYGFLILVSAPMVCSQYWGASIFLWACLLFAAISRLKKMK